LNEVLRITLLSREPLKTFLASEKTGNARKAHTSIAEPSDNLNLIVPDAGLKRGMHIFMTSTSAYGASALTWLPSGTKNRINLQGVSAINRDGS